MYMIKSGSMYLTDLGTWTPNQTDAMRLDKPGTATNNSPRFVKLRPAHDAVQDAPDSITITGRDLMIQT